MPYQVTATEYVTINGVPLMTPAWHCDDFSELLNGPSTRGADITVGTRGGQIARRRTLDARQASLALVIYGDKDAEGNTHTDKRAGLFENIDTLKAALTPNQWSTAGTRELRLITESITRTAQVHVSPDIQVSPFGPGAARATILVTIPEGVFRDTASDTTTYTAAGAHSYAQDGTGIVTDATIVVAADSDGFTITNNTTGTQLVFSGATDAAMPVTIDCGAYRATRSDSTDMSGYVQTVNTPIWAPFAAGTNSITITFDSATGPVSVQVTTTSVWL
jgi:hypothetical protein